MTHVLVPLVVLLPLLGAALALVTGRFPRLQILISTGTLALVTIVSIVLLVMVDADGPAVIEVGAWPAPWGIVLMVDRLSAIMLVISSVVLLAVLLYAIGQGIADGDRETPVSIFHPTYLMLAAGLAVAFVAGDLFNLYVGFEILLGASMCCSRSAAPACASGRASRTSWCRSCRRCSSSRPSALCTAPPAP
ncbi:hypothetical protein GCM10025876_29230 [Demequina litorisediminis]|uniref:Na(+)/H(+) antiporter subunit D n=1 Tax=Demequina litorisediminis TaxID=1849022 RepID=A0ABQ6IJ42_9MICO|nr:hypothetical protein GCM10025876_29230 [Demequina litorisediminis]